MSVPFQQNLETSASHARQVSLASTFSVYSSVSSVSRASSEQIPDNICTPAQESSPPSFSLDEEGLTASGSENDEDDTGRPLIREGVSYNRFTGECSLSEISAHKPLKSPSGRLSPVEARRSTRELISKYEAISGACGHSTYTRIPSQSHITPSAAPIIQRRDLPLPELPSRKVKPQTPFSFRNFFAVFGRKNRVLKPAQVCDSVSDTNFPKTENDFIISYPSSHTGPALYLSSSTRSLTWCPCIVTFHTSHLTLTFSDDARRTTHIIPFIYCVDVMSLAIHQLGGEIPMPAISRGKDTGKVAHVFELTFEGYKPSKERLAAWSAAERGRWVSAIWDAILVCHDQKNCTSSSEDVVREPLLKVVNGTSQSSLSTSSLFQVFPGTAKSEHIEDKRSVNSSVHVPNKTTGLRRQGAPSGMSSAPSSFTSSPSIQAIGSMSIVRQRLAKLDAQEPFPQARSSTEGISVPEHFVTSMNRHTPRKNTGEQCDRHSFENDEEPPTPSFTALDAHAMYHELPLEPIETQMPHADAKNSIRKDGSQATTSLIIVPNADRMGLIQSAEGRERQVPSDVQVPLNDDVDTVVVCQLNALPRGTGEIEMASVHAKLDQIQKDTTGFDLGAIHTSLKDIASSSRTCGSSPNTLGNLSASSRQSLSEQDLSNVVMKLDELQSNQRENFPLIIRRLTELEAPTIVHPDIAPATTEFKADLSEMHTKLDGLTALTRFLTDTLKSSMKVGPAELNSAPHLEDSEVVADLSEGAVAGQTTGGAGITHSSVDLDEIVKFLELLGNDQQSRETQAQQQADTVKYLNDLNTWLQNFARSSVDNSRQLVIGVNQLCREWLPVTETPATAKFVNAQADENQEYPKRENAFTSLQYLLAEGKGNTAEVRGLQKAIQSLTETVKEDMEKNAEARLEMQRHAQAQESLVRGLAVELTKEIRGERLRFVDAMKDATSVNVAMHVEEFKKVLERLYHEKTVLEQQIAELFSFIAKQRPEQPQHPKAPIMEAHPPQRRPLPQAIDLK